MIWHSVKMFAEGKTETEPFGFESGPSSTVRQNERLPHVQFIFVGFPPSGVARGSSGPGGPLSYLLPVARPRESGADLRGSVDAIVVCHASEITSK